MIINIQIEVEDCDDSPREVAENIQSNLEDALGHCPYPATIISCEAKVLD